jgi:hypothetical protein
MRFVATVKAGKVDMAPLTRQRLDEWCATHEGARLLITHVKPERSLSELRMYRAWLHGVAEQTGNDENELHELLIEKCAPTVVVTIKGAHGTHEIERKKRTSGGHSLTMSKGEMAEYMAKCAAFTGYPLPTEEELAAMGYLPH